MKWPADMSVDDLLSLKPQGFFRVERKEGFTVCTVYRPGEPVEHFLCHSPGHANQVRMALSDEGLAGFFEEAL